MNERVKGNNRFFLLFYVVFYRLLLDNAYFKVMVTDFSYEGFQDHRTMTLLVLSWIVLIVFSSLFSNILVNSDERVSSIVVLLLFLISFVPFTTCIYSGILSYGFIVYNILYWCVLLIAQSLNYRYPLKTLSQVGFGNYVFGDKSVITLGICSLIIVLYISGRYTHFRLNFNLFNVYSLRAEASKYNLPTIVSYMFAWTRAINPILLAYCLLNQKRLLSIIFFISQMLSFGIDGLKATFFMPFLVIVGVFFYNKVSAEQLKKWIVIAFTCVVLIGFLERIIIKNNLIYTLFTRRIMFLPSYIGNCYFDFFSKNEPDFFKESILRFVGANSRYLEHGGVTLTIGETYYRSGVNFNNGLSSDAVANLGIIGCVVMPIVLIIVLRYLDRSAYLLDKRLTIATALYLSVVFLSSFLTTVLITHGVVVLIILLSMVRREKNYG